MKETVKTITRTQWAAIQSEAQAAIADIPERNNRVRAHTYARVIADGLKRHEKTREIETASKPAVYAKSVNIGYSRKWSDYVKEYELITTKPHNERRVNLWYLYR